MVILLFLSFNYLAIFHFTLISRVILFNIKCLMRSYKKWNIPSILPLFNIMGIMRTLILKVIIFQQSNHFT